MRPVFQKMQVDQEEPHVEEQQQQTPVENKTESEEMEVCLSYVWEKDELQPIT